MAIRKALLSLLPALLWAARPIQAAGAPRATAYAFGVLNQASRAETLATWGPLLEHVARKTGLALEFRMGETVEKTDEMTARGEFDFVYNNHVFKPKYARTRYRVLAKLDAPLVGVIIVRDGSPFKSLSDLKGRRVSFPSKDAFIAYTVTRRALEGAGAAVEEKFAGNQQAAANMLNFGLVEAASLNKGFADRYLSEHQGFRVLDESQAWPNIPILAHPRVPAQAAGALRKAFVELASTEEGRELLGKLKLAGFAAASDAEYEETRSAYAQ